MPSNHQSPKTGDPPPPARRTTPPSPSPPATAFAGRDANGSGAAGTGAEVAGTGSGSEGSPPAAGRPGAGPVAGGTAWVPLVPDGPAGGGANGPGACPAGEVRRAAEYLTR